MFVAHRGAHRSATRIHRLLRGLCDRGCVRPVCNTVCYSELNVKLCPTHSGIAVGPDGGSHQMLEDIVLMRVLPGMRVVVPADACAAAAAIRVAAATPGPFYVRPGCAIVLRVGTDVTLAACGVMVERTLGTAELFAAEGISAEVIDVATIKPIEVETIVASVAKTGAVVICEAHSIIGGLGSAVAEVVCEHMPAPLRRVGARYDRRPR